MPMLGNDSQIGDMSHDHMNNCANFTECTILNDNENYCNGSID